MAPTVRRHLCFWSAALTVAVTLSGCTFPDDTAAPAPTPSPTASATSTPASKTLELEPGTVVATGTLTGDERVSGNVEVRVTSARTFELRLLDFQSRRDDDVELRVSTDVVPPGTGCTGSRMQISFGHLPTDSNQVFPLMTEFSRGNPSFLRTVMITIHSPVPAENGCPLVALSTAILNWTMPDLRPGLIVQDSGPTGGATGVVTLDAGVPLSYTIARNDLVLEVAARFGITLMDLRYLNPMSLTGAVPILKEGETLNLSKDHR